MLQLGTLSEKYGEKVPSRVPWVFEGEGCMKAVQKRAMEDPNISRVNKLFLCKHISAIDRVFFDWETLSGEKVAMF